MRTRVLITGAAGFIGSHLVGKCLDAGHEVHVAVRDGTSLRRLDDVMREIAVHRVDLGAEAAVSRCLAQARPHQVYHLASQTRDRFTADVSAMLDAARNQLWDLAVLLKGMTDLYIPPEVFVRSGSIAEYGPGPTPFREEQQGVPSTAYAAALLAGTQFMDGVRRNLPFRAITTRLALVYGSDQSEEFLIPRLIRCCLNGLPCKIARPDDRRDLLFIDDAVTALVRTGEDPPADCGIINVATGLAPSMREVAGQVLKATGADPGLLGFAEAGPGGSSELLASPDLARRVIGWSARTSLADGIAETVARQRHREPATV